MANEKTPVTSLYLLQGAVYAFEQCGYLLSDARSLYNEGSYGTAVALTAFAHGYGLKEPYPRGLWHFAIGCQKVSAEQVSSVAEREKLEAALEYVREGDILVVTKLDRLARSVSHLVAIGERLKAKSVALRVLDQAIDTSNCTGRLMFNMLGAIAQFERELDA